MPEHDEDLRTIFRTVADGADLPPGAERKLLAAARRRRRITATAAALSLLLLVGGIAGASTLVGGRDGTEPTLSPAETSGCVPVGYDLSVFVPDGASEAEILELGEALEAHDAVLRAEFVTAEEAEQEFRAANPDHEGPLSSTQRVDQYRLDLRPGIQTRDGGPLMRELANMGEGATAPALECPQEEADTTFARYFFEAAVEDISVSGVVEVNSLEGTFCLEGTLSDNIVAAHLIDQHESDAPLITFLDPNEQPQGAFTPGPGANCIRTDDLDLLQLIVDDVERFAVDFHRGPNDNPGLIAQLQRSPAPQWTSLSQPPIRTGGYIFNDITMKFRSSYDDPLAGRVAVSGEIWFDSGLPGTRECRFDLYDHRGELAGGATKKMLVAAPGPAVLIDSLDVTGVPDRLDVACSEKRLDDPDGQFTFGTITLEPDPGRGDRAFRAKSRYTWRGEGSPPPQRCTLLLLGPAGRTLLEVKGGLIAADGRPGFIEFGFELSEDMEDRLEDAEVECRPIR